MLLVLLQGLVMTKAKFNPSQDEHRGAENRRWDRQM